MASYEEEGLYMALKDLAFKFVSGKYAKRTMEMKSYVKHAQEFDGETLMKVVVALHMWIGVDIYTTVGSISSIKGIGIPYEWICVDSHGVERHSDVASRGAWIWAIYKD